MRREGVGEAEERSEACTVGARAEDPERHLEPGAGDGPDRIVVRARAEEQLQVLHVVGEPVGAQQVSAQRAGRDLVGARRPAETEIDPAGIQRLERAELLGDDERGVVRQHDPAGTDPDRRGAGCEVPRDDGRRCAGDRLHVVVLGDPVALVAEALRVLGEVEAVAQRDPRCRPTRDRGEVEDREGDGSHEH